MLHTITILIYYGLMTNMEFQPSRAEQASVEQKCAEPTAVDADVLFAGSRIVLIEYRGEHYQLRRTRAGKLILTK
jgi:hemin uptake protein HemP